MNEGVTQGVNLGYRVIEDYVRQGQSFASTMWAASDARVPRADSNPAMGRLIQYAADFAAIWLDMMKIASAPVTAPTPRTDRRVPEFDIGTTAEPTAGSAPVAQTAPPVVELDIRASRQVQVTVELKPLAGATRLIAHELRAAGPEPRLTGVRIESSAAGDRVVIRLEVPDSQPPGVYSGIIVDVDSNLPRGTLAVRLPPG